VYIDKTGRLGMGKRLLARRPQEAIGESYFAYLIVEKASGLDPSVRADAQGEGHFAARGEGALFVGQTGLCRFAQRFERVGERCSGEIAFSDVSRYFR
jgi:hypothetical protein